METAHYPELPNYLSPEDSLIMNGTWEYKMRREMQEIVSGVYLGPYAVASKSKLLMLRNAEITHIICVRHYQEANFIKPNFPDNFRYLVLNIADKSTENIISVIPQVKEFIDGCLNAGGKVLIHGNGGLSRSAALVIAYVMETYGVDYKTSLKYVQQRRFCINPNEGFAQQLTEYEPIYQAKHSFLVMQQQMKETGNFSAPRLKRSREDDEDMT